MTVKELRDEIKDVPDDTIIVLSCDGEGNSFTPAAEEVSLMNYNVVREAVRARLLRRGHSKRAACLHPVAGQLSHD